MLCINVLMTILNFNSLKISTESDYLFLSYDAISFPKRNSYQQVYSKAALNDYTKCNYI